MLADGRASSSRRAERIADRASRKKFFFREQKKFFLGREEDGGDEAACDGHSAAIRANRASKRRALLQVCAGEHAQQAAAHPALGQYQPSPAAQTLLPPLLQAVPCIHPASAPPPGASGIPQPLSALAVETTTRRARWWRKLGRVYCESSMTAYRHEGLVVRQDATVNVRHGLTTKVVGGLIKIIGKL